MTTIREIEQKCSVCGKTSPQSILNSTNSYGYPDLDFRPPEMHRSTMNTWIQECPHCGYIAQDITNELNIPKDILKSKEYTTCDGYEFKNNLAKKFYKSYLIMKESNNTHGCFINLRSCAWKCDDAEDSNATEMRKLAIPYIDKLINEETKDKEIYILTKIDFLRRTNQFNQITDEFSTTKLENEKFDKILKFQIKKAKEQDAGQYTGEDVFGEIDLYRIHL